MVDKVLKRYVIATVGDTTQYLKSLHFGKYVFTDNTVECTKTIDKKTANMLIDYYYNDTGFREIELVAIPLAITYELINELE